MKKFFISIQGSLEYCKNNLTKTTIIMPSDNKTNSTKKTIPQIAKHDLLSWINNLLQLKLTTIEQLGSGAVYCQILDSMHPGKVPLNKLNWQAKL